MFKPARQQKHSPGRVGHLEETPPVQRKVREVRIHNNENRDVSNFNRREFCEFVCDESYKNSFECEDVVKHSMNIQPAYLNCNQDNFLKLTHSQ